MEKYKLSVNVSVSGISDSDIYAVPDKYKQDNYILFDKRRDKEFLINSTTKYFFDKFSTPKTIDEIVHEVAVDVHIDKSLVEEMCLPFFKFLCNKNILLPESEKETIFSKIGPLYSEGDQLDQGTILKVLSERNLIDVYLAINKSTGFIYAIKLLSRDKCKDETTYQKALSELEREYQTLKGVAYISSMCQAYEFNKASHHLAYFTLEYIDGKSLSHFLNETDTLFEEEDAMWLIGSILLSFSSLHRSKIIHGDIHPSNILVLKDRSIKIINLGLSRNVDTDKSEVLNLGAVNFYMPPERINTTSITKYLKAPDLYSDVYQIGLLMYLVLYNDLPFDGFVWEELATNIKETDAIFAENAFLNYAVSEQLISIIQKCLKKEPSERYNNGEEILADFKNFLLRNV